MNQTAFGFDTRMATRSAIRFNIYYRVTIILRYNRDHNMYRYPVHTSTSESLQNLRVLLSARDTRDAQTNTLKRHLEVRQVHKIHAVWSIWYCYDDRSVPDIRIKRNFPVVRVDFFFLVLFVFGKMAAAATRSRSFPCRSYRHRQVFSDSWLRETGGAQQSRGPRNRC